MKIGLSGWLLSIVVGFFQLPLFSQVVVDSGEKAISIALHHSKSQLLQQMKVKEGMRQARISIKDFLPQLGFSYSESDVVKVGMVDSRSKNLQLSLSQLIFDGGQARNQYQVNNLMSMYHHQEYLQTLEEFKAQVLESYQKILCQKQVVQVKNWLRLSGEKRLAVIQEEYNLGLAREIDYLDYVLSCRNLVQEEKLAQEELERQYIDFRQLLGLEFGTEIIVNQGDNSLYSDKKTAEPEGTNPSLGLGQVKTEEKNYRALAPELSRLISLCLNFSPSLKRQQLEYAASVKQEEMSKKWYLPNLSLEGSLTLSGTEFPLREPDYSVRLKVSFDRNPFLPLTTNTSLGLDQKRIRSLGNSVSGSLNPDPAYFSKKTLSSISLMQGQLSLALSQDELRDSLRELVLQHDNSLQNLEFLHQSLDIQKKKVAIGFQQLEGGDMTEMDYLEILIELAAMEIQLVELESSIESISRAVELSSGLKPGGIYER